MKILMIAPTPFFADRGCHTRIYGEIVSLQKMGHEVILCTYGLGRDMKGIHTERCFNFPWYKKLSAGPSISKIFLLPFLLFTCMKHIRKFKPTIVHAFLHEGALIARICNLIYKGPSYFFDLQGSLTGELLSHRFFKKNGLLYRIFSFIERKINSWFPIITQSENLVAQLISSGVPEDRIINAMDGVDTDYFFPRPKDTTLLDSLKLKPSDTIVLYIGLLETYQGVDLMFDAFSKVIVENKDVQFVIIGFPNIDAYKEKAQLLGVSVNTHFVGKVRFDEVPRYLSLADIAMAPKISLSEGDGKLYNYMAMGLPIVATDRSVSREILGNEDPCGLLCEYNDADNMAYCINKLISDKNLRQKLGKNARIRTENYLSCDISARKIEKFYLDVIGKRKLPMLNITSK